MPGQFSGVRGLAQNFIPELIGEGMSNAAIVDFMRLNDLGYRTQSMYSDINRIRLEQFGAESIKGLDMFTQVPERFMREWQGEIDFRYRVVVQYEYVDAESGLLLKTASTLYYNDAPSVNIVLEDWDVRTKTLEGGFGSTVNVQRIEGITEVNYFVNRAKEVG